MMLGGLSGLYLNIFTSCRLRSCWEVVERLLGGISYKMPNSKMPSCKMPSPKMPRFKIA